MVFAFLINSYRVLMRTWTSALFLYDQFGVFSAVKAPSLFNWWCGRVVNIMVESSLPGTETTVLGINCV